MSKQELLIGCGSNWEKRMSADGTRDWACVTTLDYNGMHKPDLEWDLMDMPLPSPDNFFDEVHAYEVLEHCGRQGDYKYFFDQFNELWRILKPGGLLFASCPMWDSPWAWSDPGHTRVITRQSLIFLQLEEYHQLGKTHMTDYRHLLTGDWELMAGKEDTDIFSFCMRAKK